MTLTASVSSLSSSQLMKKDILFEINHDRLRANFNKYTRKAFQMLPTLKKPRILDIGCGSGVPTLELARLSMGEVIGIDIDQTRLNKFNIKIKEANLAHRVKTMKCSLKNMKFPNKSFDIIWAEGTTWIIGFQKALKAWRRFIKPNGFLVVHDELGDIDKKIELIFISGYKLIDKFFVPGDAWWNEYYHPLEKRIHELRKKYQNNPKILNVLDKEQREVEEYKKNPKYHGSVFFVMQKI